RSDDKDRGEPATGRSEVRRLALVDSSRRQKRRPVIGINPNVQLEGLRLTVDPDPTFAGLGQRLCDIAALLDLLPNTPGHLVSAIHRLAAVSTRRLEEIPP